MFVRFTIYNKKHSPSKNYRIYRVLLWGLKMQMKMSFMVLQIRLLGFGKVLEKVKNDLTEDWASMPRNVLWNI